MIADLAQWGPARGRPGSLTVLALLDGTDRKAKAQYRRADNSTLPRNTGRVNVGAGVF